MSERWKREGLFDQERLEKSAGFPSEERLEKGPVAILECLEEIPCDPCQSACPQAAIEVGKPLTNLPVFLEDKCNGCTLCIPQCPGMAIFVVDLTYSENDALVYFPYEFLPLPAVRDEVDAVDREGKIVTKAKAKRIQNPRGFNKTAVITLVVPRDLAMEVRGIRTIGKQQAMRKPAVSGNDQETESNNLLPQMICRCEEIERTEMNKAIEQGADSIKGIKNRTRAGMGLCQGRVCTGLSRRLLVQTAGMSPEQIKPPSIRSPVRPVELGILASGVEDD